MAIKGQPFYLSRQLLLADGSDATGLTPTVRIKIDGAAWKPATNAPTEPDPTNDPGAYELLLDAGEMSGNQLQVAFREATIVTVLTTIDLVAAAQWSTFDNTTDEVTTDAASRTASQADVSDIPKRDDATATYRQLRDVDSGTQLQEIRETLTTTKQGT